MATVFPKVLVPVAFLLETSGAVQQAHFFSNRTVLNSEQ
jgi:hypothetical protein